MMNAPVQSTQVNPRLENDEGLNPNDKILAFRKF